MAFNPSQIAPGATDLDPNFVGGKYRDNAPATTNNGTPIKAILHNQRHSMEEAAMRAAGFEYSGTADNPNDSQLFKALKAGIGSGANLLSNHNFLTQTPDDSQPRPDSTPRTYPPGYQIFSGVFTNETIGITNLTYIDGHVSFTAGDFYFAVPNTGAIEQLTEFSASVADFDGKPRTEGVSYSLVGDDYRITVGVDALTDGDVGSVKFEQGEFVTGHEAQRPTEAKTFPSLFTDPSYTTTNVWGVGIGDSIVVEDYAPGNKSGVLFFKVAEAGTGTHDGGKYIDIPTLGIQLVQNMPLRTNVKCFGAAGAGLSHDDTDSFQNALNYTKGDAVYVPYTADWYNITNGIKGSDNGVWFYSDVMPEIRFDNTGKVNVGFEYNTTFAYQVTTLADKPHFKLNGLKVLFTGAEVGNHAICWKSYDTEITKCKLDGAKSNTVFLFNETTNINISDNNLTNCVKNHISILGESEAESKRGELSISKGRLMNNIIDGTVEENGIFVGFALQQFIITGNIISDVGDSGIEYGGAPRGEFGTKYTIVSDNLVTGTGKFKPGPGILLANAYHVRGEGNIVKDAKYGCQVVLGSDDIDIGITTVNSEVTGFLCDGSTNVSARVNNTQSDEALRINSSKNVEIELNDYSFDKCVVKQNWYGDLDENVNVKVTGRTKVPVDFDAASNNRYGLVYNFNVDGENFNAPALFDVSNDWFTTSEEMYNKLEDGDEIAIVKSGASDTMPSIGGAGEDDAYINNGERYYAIKAPSNPGAGVYPVRLCARFENVALNQYLDITSSGTGSFTAHVVIDKPSTQTNEQAGVLIPRIQNQLPRNFLRNANEFEATYTSLNGQLTITSSSLFSLVGWELGNRDDYQRQAYMVRFKYLTTESNTRVIIGGYTNSGDKNPSLAELIMNETLPLSGVWVEFSAMAIVPVGSKPLLYLAFQAGTGVLNIKDLEFRQVGVTGSNSYNPTPSVLDTWLSPAFGGASTPPAISVANPHTYRVGENWFNSSTNQLSVCDGSAWNAI